MDFEAFEDLSRYPLDEQLRDTLLDEQVECAVIWSDQDRWPLGVIHWFVWENGRFWVTTTSARQRVEALQQRPESSVIVSGVGTSLGHGRTITAKTRASILNDEATAEWFFPALADKAWPQERGRAGFLQMLRSTDRVIIELKPVSWITFDAREMYRTAQRSERGG